MEQNLWNDMDNVYDESVENNQDPKIDNVSVNRKI